MNKDEALRVLELHRKVLAGYHPTPSRAGHDLAIEEALCWALDELEELTQGESTDHAREGVSVAPDPLPAADTQGDALDGGDE